MPKPVVKYNPVPTGASIPVKVRPRFPVWLIAALLALVTIVLYWPATRHDFVNYDDELVIGSNVQSGLTLENIRWAFFNPVNSLWHPLTVLSHMLDCQMYGLQPWGHHLTSVLLHALNVALVFALLQQLTGAIWRSLLVAALFGLHPLHVESVAWVAERKDVLSTCFGLLALMFYARYAQKPASGVRRLMSGDYWLALVFFAFGLMSKPMLVTWPFVMLLLDYWPLERFKCRSAGRLVTEKVPFFALMVATSIVTFVVQKRTGALVVVENLPLGARGGNALISYCRYLGKLFWPTDLAVFYPYPGYWPMEPVLLAGGLMAGISVFLLMQRRRYPFLLMGWLWFVGTLVPVIGLVQAGEQAMADRYAYIPSLGLLILAIWGAYELTRHWREHVVILTAAGCVTMVLCIGLTRQQLGYWQDSETLFRHAIEVTENNYLAHKTLGDALRIKGEMDGAIRQYQEAIRLKPDYAEACNNLGNVLDQNGEMDEAIRQYQEAIRLKPDYAEAYNNLGAALGQKGQTDEAIRQFQEAIRLKPDYAGACDNLARAMRIKNAPASR